MKRPLALLILIIGFNLFYTSAQEAELPSWVIFGLGKREAEEKNYPQAIKYFRQAIEKRGIFPEAERELAMVMGLGGDPSIQKKTLERALAHSNALEVPQDKILILYDLARMEASGPDSVLAAGQQRLETALEQILQEDLGWTDSRSSEGRNPMVTIWRGMLNYSAAETPLDRLLYLFGQRSDMTIEAHQLMAQLLTRSKKKAWDRASEHWIFASLYLVSRLKDEFLQIEPSLENPSLMTIFDADFLGGASERIPKEDRYVLKKYEPLLTYLEENKFWETLYNLALSLWERKDLTWDTWSMSPDSPQFKDTRKPRPPEHTTKDAAKVLWSFLGSYGPAGNLWVKKAIAEIKKR